MSDLDAEIAAAQQSRGVGLASADADDEFYGSSGTTGLADSIDAGPEEEDEGDEPPQKRQTFTAPKRVIRCLPSPCAPWNRRRRVSLVLIFFRIFGPGRRCGQCLRTQRQSSCSDPLS